MFALATKLLSGVWGYVAAAALSASIAAYGAYQVTAWAKDETINRMKLADAQAVATAYQKGAAEKEARDAISYDIGIASAKAQQKIDDATKANIERVTIYVPAKADFDCILPNGFIKLLDAAGLASDPDAIPGAAGEPNDAPSGLRLSQATALLAANLGNAAKTRKQVMDWQAWANAQLAQNAAAAPGK